MHQSVSPRAGDPWRKQEESPVVSEAGDALSKWPRHDAGEHVPEAWAKVPGMSEMPGIVEGENAPSLGD